MLPSLHGGIILDKQKVVLAYRKGYLTIKECAQLLGMDPTHVLGMLEFEGAYRQIKYKTVH